MPPHVMREAVESDIRQCCAIDHLLQADRGRLELVTNSIRRRECIVASDRPDHVAGYLILNYGFFDHGFIALVVVADDVRRQGVALRLMQEAMARCKRPKLFTSCNTSNVAARALFEKCGFTSSGSVTNLDAGDDELFFFKSTAAP